MFARLSMLRPHPPTRLVERRPDMGIQGSLCAVLALAVGLAGCSYNYFGSSDAQCFASVREDEFRIPRSYANWLRFWQGTEYCRRLREEFARSVSASLPDFGVVRPQQRLVVGNVVTFEVGVRNESTTTASPDFDVLIEAFAGVVPPAAPTFSTIQRFTGLAPQAENRITVDVPVPAQRPVDVLIRVTADPPAATGGAVREADENNNVRERTFTIF
jgi:hypothetical protein